MSALRDIGIRIHKTRYPELGYAQVMRGAWRFVDMSSEATIGYNYPSKAELLADLTRFAKDFGCEGVS